MLFAMKIKGRWALLFWVRKCEMRMWRSLITSMGVCLDGVGSRGAVAPWRKRSYVRMLGVCWGEALTLERKVLMVGYQPAWGSMRPLMKTRNGADGVEEGEGR